MTIKGVIFDFDGVLVDSLPAHLDFCRDVADKAILPRPKIPTPAEFKSGIARSGKAISPMLNFLLAVGFRPGAAKRAQEQYSNEFWKTDLNLFDGVGDMLNALSRTDAKLGIVTANERKVVEKALQKMPDVFERNAIVTKDGDSEDFAKAQALRTIARTLECDTSELLFVGDQHSDYAAAIEAGTEFLGVTYGWAIALEDRYIRSVERPSDIITYIHALDREDGARPRTEDDWPQQVEALTHAREMFSYYAGQRLVSIRFYLVALTIILTALVALVTSDSGITDTLLGRLGIPFIAIAGLFITYIFYRLDKRNEMLVESSERLARRMEFLLRLRTGFPEFETLAFTDEVKPKETRYGRLIPRFFAFGFVAFVLAAIGSFSLPRVTSGDKRARGDADGSGGDTTSGGSGDTVAFDSWSNELLLPVLLVAIVAVFIVVLFLLLRQEREDKWITGAKRVTALAGAFAAVIGVLAAGVALVGDAAKLWKQDVQITRIFSIPGFLPNPSEPTVFVLDNEAAVIPRPVDEVLATFVVPFEDEASCQTLDAAGRWQGTYPEKYASFLRRLGGDLAACAAGEEKPAVVRVKGYASSSKPGSPTRCAGAPNDEDANLAIAHRRAAEVEKLLLEGAKEVEGKGADPRALRIVPHKWQDANAMKQGRSFNDRLLNGAYDRSKGILNRRVDVELLEAPLCDDAKAALKLRP